MSIITIAVGFILVLAFAIVIGRPRSLGLAITYASISIKRRRQINRIGNAIPPGMMTTLSRRQARRTIASVIYHLKQHGYESVTIDRTGFAVYKYSPEMEARLFKKEVAYTSTKTGSSPIGSYADAAPCFDGTSTITITNFQVVSGDP